MEEISSMIDYLNALNEHLLSIDYSGLDDSEINEREHARAAESLLRDAEERISALRRVLNTIR